MKTTAKSILPFIYFATALIEITGELMRTTDTTPWLVYISKPLLMPMLMIWFLFDENALSSVIRKCVFISLIFSMGGDIFLMFHADHLFVFGLSSFLLAHVLYIVGFWHQVSGSLPWGGRFVLSLPYILFILGFLYILKGHILRNDATAPLFIPVVVYASVIGIMGMAASWRVSSTNRRSFYFILFGALLFILSDSMIAINKFVSSIPYVAVWVMSTYVTAQFLIVKGTLIHSKIK